MKRFILIAALLASSAFADAPVIWNGATAKWLPSGLKSAGMCQMSAAGVQSVYTTNGLIKMASGVPGAAVAGTDFIGATSGSAIQKANGAGGLTAATGDTDYQNPITLATFGSSPSASGASFTSDTLTIQPADATHPGAVSATTQSFQGKKTFVNGLDAGSNQITAVSDPTTAQMAATKNYVDTQLLQLNPAAAVFAASTTNITGTYANAVGGVCIGDTFTITATGAISLDSVSPTLGSRVLLKNQTSSFQDGVWTVTVLGTTGVSPVLTRATDFDSSADINAGQIVPVINGTVNAGSSWYQTAVVSTCNSDAQTWTQFQKASSAYLLAANNFSDVGTPATAFNNVSGMTATGDVIVGGASGVRSKLAIGSSAQFMQVVSGTPAWSTMSGDATMASGGAVTLKNIGSGAGSCTNCSVTFDAQGRQTAYSSGAGSGGSVANAINTQSGTTYTLALTDGQSNGNNPLVSTTNSTGVTVTVPTNASVAFAVGDQVNLTQQGAGELTLSPAGGVTINSVSGVSASAGEYALIYLIKTATNVWTLAGQLLSPIIYTCTSCTAATSGNQKILTFNASDTLIITSNTANLPATSFMVGGGGGGTGGNDGGGAGGGVLCTTNNSIPAGSYTVTIGGGGAGNGNAAHGSVGSNTTFNGLTAGGGGYGGLNGNAGGPGSATNGNGGGAGNGSGLSGGTASGAGFAGGGATGTQSAGGGGGAGGAGGAGTGTGGTSALGGAGGVGLIASGCIPSNSNYYGGGGGGSPGGAQTSPALGGTGGGGNSGYAVGGQNPGSSGTANTGGGGGGALGANNGGNGGSGIVQISWQYK